VLRHTRGAAPVSLNTQKYKAGQHPQRVIQQAQKPKRYRIHQPENLSLDMDAHPMTAEALPPTTSSSTADSDASITTTPTLNRSVYFKLMDNKPLYTEINIPLPPLPSTLPAQTRSAPSNHFTSVSTPQCSHDRSRPRSLSSFSPFRARSSSRTSDESARRSGPG
jgi:hypothetical protein